MLRAQAGAIIIIASGLGERSAVPCLYPSDLESLRPTFFFAKAGVTNHTRFLAVAHAARGFRADCLNPGYHPVGGKGVDSDLRASRAPM